MKMSQFISITLVIILGMFLNTCGQMTSKNEGMGSKSIEEASGTTDDTTTTDNTTTTESTPWNQLTNMTTSRKRMDSAAIGNKIYVAGGDIYPSTSTDVFEVYDINTNSWSTLTALPETRMYLSSIAFNSSIYILGGFFDASYPPTTLTTIKKYTPSSDSWSNIGSQYSGNTYMQQVSDPISNKIYWISGSSTYEFDLSSNSLTNCGSSCGSLPSITSGCNRTVISLVTVSNTVYALSYVSSGSCTNATHLDKFDVSSNAWTYLSSSPSPKYNLTACAANSKIYILGGTYGSVQSSVEEYDPATNTWETKGAIPYGGLTEHACVTVNNKIYLIGGEPSGGNKTNTLYVYNPSFDTD